MPEPAVSYLFVYGTLLKSLNLPAHQHYLAKGTTYIGTGTFRGKLYNVGEYPGAVHSQNLPDKIYGEIYSFADWSVIMALDAYEGCDEVPAEFIRTRVPVQLDNGVCVDAFIYLYNFDVRELPCIPCGNYAAVKSNVFHQQ
jgi:gamma-glutamylcyclotransferase (GGCT)/AIG2-like uncharacterized protein YtfP